MKKILILILLFIFVFFLILVNTDVRAQAPTGINVPGTGAFMIPGVDCGNAEADVAPAQSCCKRIDVVPDINPFLNKLSIIPFLGDIINKVNQINQQVLQAQRSANITPCPIGYPSTSDQNDPTCLCLKQSQITPSPIEEIKKICSDYYTASTEYNSCIDCANSAGILTAVGCISGDVNQLIQKTVFGWGIGLAGLISILCIIYAAFMMQTSQGNPEKIKKAQELLTSCIMGLMLIIFSVFILRLIGLDILKIPGFRK